MRCEHCGAGAASEFVTISAREYTELKRIADAYDAGLPARNSPRFASRSPIARDPELSAFILAAARTKTIQQIVIACRERFGVNRAPTKSSVDRFLRQVARKVTDA